jgi:hypothetical protein
MTEENLLFSPQPALLQAYLPLNYKKTEVPAMNYGALNEISHNRPKPSS